MNESEEPNVKLKFNDIDKNLLEENEKNQTRSQISINDSGSIVFTESEDVEERMEKLINLQRNKLLAESDTPNRMNQLQTKKSRQKSIRQKNEEEKLNPSGLNREMSKETHLRRKDIKNELFKNKNVRKESTKENAIDALVQETEENKDNIIDDNDDDDDDEYRLKTGEERDTQLLEYDKFYKELFFKNEVFKFDAKFKDKDEEQIAKEEEKLKLKNLIKEKTKIRDVAALKGLDTTKMDKELNSLKEHQEYLKKTKKMNLEMNMNNTEGLLYKGNLLYNYFSEKFQNKMPKFSKEVEKDTKGKEIIDFKPIDKDEMIRRFWDPCPCLKQRKKIFKFLTYAKFYSGFVVDNKIFDWISLGVILLNTAIILVSDPRDEESIQNTSDTYFLVFYTVECILKILGFGFLFTEKAYIKDAWNILDFIVIIVGWVSFVLERVMDGTKISGLTALRAFRILRPLKTVKSIKGLRRLIIALLASLAKLKDIGIVLFAFFLLFAIAGVQMWSGIFKRRCMSVNYGYMYAMTGSTAMCTFDTDCEEYNEPGNTFICAKGWKNPNNGATNFDNTLYGFVTVFIVVTTEGWTPIFNYVSLAFKDKIYMNPIINFAYFHFFIFAGAFYLINLFLAVTNSEFNNIERVRRELLTKKSFYLLMKNKYDLREKEKEEKKLREKEMQAKAKKKNVGDNIYDLKEKIVDDAFHIRKNIKDIPLTYTTIKDIYILSGNNPQELYRIDKDIDKEEDNLCDDIDRQLKEVDNMVLEEDEDMLNEGKKKEEEEEKKKVNYNNEPFVLQYIEKEYLEQSEKLTIKQMEEEIAKLAKKKEKLKQIGGNTSDELKKKIEKREMEKFNEMQVVLLEDLSFEKEKREKEEQELKLKNKELLKKKVNEILMIEKLKGKKDTKEGDQKDKVDANEKSALQLVDTQKNKNKKEGKDAGKEKQNKYIEEELIFMNDLSISSEDDDRHTSKKVVVNPLKRTQTVDKEAPPEEVVANEPIPYDVALLNQDEESFIASKPTKVDVEKKVTNNIQFSRPSSKLNYLLYEKYQERYKNKIDLIRKNFNVERFLKEKKEEGVNIKNLGRRRSFLKFIKYTQDDKYADDIYCDPKDLNRDIQERKEEENEEIKEKKEENNEENNEENKVENKEENKEEKKEVDISFFSNGQEIPSVDTSHCSDLSKLSKNNRDLDIVYDEDINLNELNKKIQLNKVTNYAKKIFLDKNSKNTAASMNSNKMKRFYEKVNKNMNENIIIDMKEPRGREIDKENVSHVYIPKEYDLDNDEPDLADISIASRLKYSSSGKVNSKLQNDMLHRNYSNARAEKRNTVDLDANLKKEDRTVGVYKTPSVEKNTYKYPKLDTMKDMVHEENKKMSNILDLRQEQISSNWRATRFYMNYLYNIKEKDLKVKDNFKMDQWRGEILGREEVAIPRQKLPESTEAEMVFNDKALNIKKYRYLNYKPFEWKEHECAYITNELKSLPFNCLEIMPIRIRDFGRYYVGKEINLGVLSNTSAATLSKKESALTNTQNGLSAANYSASGMTSKSRSNFCIASSFGTGRRVKDDFKTKKVFYEKFYKSLDTFNYLTLNQYFLDEEKLYFKMTDEKHREDRKKENEEMVKSKESAIEVKSEIKNIKLFDIKTNTSRFVEWSGSDVLYQGNFADDEQRDMYNNMIASLENFRVIIWLRAPGVKEAQKVRFALYLVSINTYFDLFIMALVLGNAIVMCLDGNTFDPETYNKVSISNYVFNSIFILEYVIKFIGLGPIIYYSDAFTYLDTIIIAFAIFDMVSPSDNSDTIGSNKKLTSQLSFLRVFRIFRVLRLTKLLRKMKSMRLIIVSIKKSLAEVAYIVLILIMFTIIFQLLGMSLMNGNIRYQSFMIAFYTTFQILSTENWNSVFYQLFPLNKLTFIYYIIWIFLGNYILFNLFISILLQSFSNDSDQEDEDDLEEGEIIDRSFGLPYYLKQLKKSEEDNSNRALGIKVKKSNANGKDGLEAASASSSRIRTSASAMSDTSENNSSSSENESVDEKENADEDDDLAKNTGQIEKNMRNWKKIDDLFKKNECETVFYFLSQVNPVRIWCMKAVSSSVFEGLILAIILLSTARLIADTILEGYFWVFFFDMIDLVFNFIFLLEMVFKIIAMGLIMDEGTYLRDHWNKIDFVIVIVSLIDIKSLTDKYIEGNASSSSSLNFLKVLRLLRTLRTLRIISHNVQLKLIISSLLESIGPICNALIMVLVVFFMFSIVGINLFYSSFHNCYVPGKDTIFIRADSGFGNYLIQYSVATTMPAIEDFCATRYNGIMDTGPKFKFTNIGYSMIASYVLGNMEGWPDIMNDYRVYNEFYGFFFIVYLLVVSYFFLNIFTGIMFRYFNEAWSREQKLPEDDLKACKYYDFLNQVIEADPEYAIYLSPEPGTFKWFLVCIANSSFLDNFIMIVIFLNMVIMAISFDDCSEWYETLLDTLNLIFTSIFIAECVLKISALGPVCYFYVGWNQFDFFVVVASIVDLIVSNIGGINASFLKSFQIIRVLRVLRITRVLRLVKSLKSLEKLIQTLSWSIAALGNVLILMIILFCIFAILGCYLYEAIVYDDYKDELYYLNSYFNFDNFYYAFLLVFRMCTGEDWPSIMLELAFIDVDTVSSATSYAYMIVVNFLSYIIMLNLFLMVTLQQYDEFTSKSYNPVEMFENFMLGFKVSWNKLSKGEENGLILPKNLIIDFFNDFSWKKLNFPEQNKLAAIKKYVTELKLKVDQENYVYFHDVLLKIIVAQMGSRVERGVAANAIIFKQEKKVINAVRKKVDLMIKKRYKIVNNSAVLFNPLTSHLYYKISYIYMKTYVNNYNQRNNRIDEQSEESSEHDLFDKAKNQTIASKSNNLMITNTNKLDESGENKSKLIEGDNDNINKDDKVSDNISAINK